MTVEQTGNEQSVPRPKYKIGDIIVSPIRPQGAPMQLVVRKAWVEGNKWWHLCWQSMGSDPDRLPNKIPEREILYKL